jgi:glutamate/aspartate transport system permease protein
MSHLNLDFSFFTQALFNDFLQKGLIFSIQLTIVAMVGGCFIGTILALMKTSSSKILNTIATVYINFFRSIPLVMVILWFYLLIPLIIKRSIGAEFSAFITYTVFQAAYYAEIIRAGIISVSKGQESAGVALGLTYWQCMRYVILPQAIRNMIPVLMTQTIILFQDTSLVYAIGAYDLLKGFEIAGKNFNRPIETYLVAAVVYFAICFTLSQLAKSVHRKWKINR